MTPPPILPPDQRELDDQEEGSIEQIEISDETEVIETEDGGAIIKLKPGTKEDEDPEFYENLAERLPIEELNVVSSDLVERIEDDKRARDELDKFYAEGIQRTGIAEPAPGGADFPGASKVTHPVLMEAAVDFEARIIKEVWPAKGPAKMEIPGETTPEKVDKAERKVRYMNWQCTKQMPGFRSDLEQTLIQTPIGGTGYIKLERDRIRNRPKSSYVAMEAVYLPAVASNFWDAKRKTHYLTLTGIDFRDRVQSGQYLDLELGAAPSLPPETSEAKETSDKAQGLDEQGGSMNLDEVREIYESYVWLALSVDNPGVDEPSEWIYHPYIVSIEKNAEKILSIYRNWVHSDDNIDEIEWLIFFGMIPWRGPYGVGFNHMLGGLAGAATGSMRALLDAAVLANSNTAFKLDGEASGQNLPVQQTGVVSIKGANMTDDIRKAVLPNPFPGPSTVLYQLLQYVVGEAKGVIQMTFDKHSELSNNTPVGTIMAQIEQGLMPFSAIHSRIHYSMGRLLKTLHTINQLYLDDTEVFDDTGEVMVTRADFDGPLDVVPVSDPAIFTELQRAMQAQAVVQRADLKPQLYKPREVEVWYLKSLKVADPDLLLVDDMQPKRMNAVNENVAVTAGRPVSAFPEQNHLAHLQTHLDYMMSPVFGQLPILAPIVIPNLLNHIKEHLAFFYVDQVSEIMDQMMEAAGLDREEIKEMMRSTDQEETRALDELLAKASGAVLAQAAQGMGPLIPPVIQRAQQILQQFQPPQPVDPGQVAMQTLEFQKQKAGQDAQLQMQKQEQDNVVKMADVQRKQAETQLKAQQMAASAEVERENAGIRARELELSALETMAGVQAQKREGEHRQIELDLRREEAETGQRQLAAEQLIATMQLGDESDRIEREQDFQEAMAQVQLDQQEEQSALDRRHETELQRQADQIALRIQQMGDASMLEKAELDNEARLTMARLNAAAKIRSDRVKAKESQAKRAQVKKSKPAK